MKELKKLRVWFMPKRAKLLKNGEAPIYARIYVGEQRAEFSIKRSINIKYWDPRKEQATRNHEDLNNYIAIVKARIIDIYNDLARRDEIITAREIKNIYKAQLTGDKIDGICHLYDNHNKQCRSLIGIDYTESTVRKFEYTLRVLREFVFVVYNAKDCPLERLDYNFIRKYELFLKNVRHCSNNSAVNNIKVLKKIVKIAVNMKLLNSDPFEFFKYKLTETTKEFLTASEISTIAKKKFSCERLTRVRDVFLFCCFTSLSFADVSTLTKQHIYVDGNSDAWIRKGRVKTNVYVNIPLITPAKTILEKYADEKREALLPLPKNQKFNAYLKEIADLCGIRKHLTSHTARLTCATTVLLSNKMTIENVASILGHKSLKTTQHYAKILDENKKRDMVAVENKFVDFVQM